MSPRTRDILNALGTAVFLLFTPALFSPLARTGFLWLQTAPRSFAVQVSAPVIDFGLQIGTFFLLFGLGLALAAPTATIVFLIQRKRRLSAISFGIWMMSWICWGAAPPGSIWISRRVALLRIAKNAQPVQTALEQYRVDNGHYPDSLNDLVPGYLPTEPRPDALGCPAYRYRLPAADARPAFRGYGLKLNTPTGGNWDSFVYWPDREYPHKMYGGSVEPIGEWAYVHE